MDGQLTSQSTTPPEIRHYEGLLRLTVAMRSMSNEFEYSKVKNQCELRKKTLITFHYNGWFIGILVMAYYNPYIIG